MFMAFHTRKIKIRALNDSKEIAAIVYINSIILVLLIVVEFPLRQYHYVYASLYGLALLVGGSLFLGLTFIPKVNCSVVSVNHDCNSYNSKLALLVLTLSKMRPRHNSNYQNGNLGVYVALKQVAGLLAVLERDLRDATYNDRKQSPNGASQSL